jgi:iron complex outermembrane receptor protein
MKYLITCLITLITISFTQAQSLKGSVKDDKSGETLIGASVVVSGTQKGASTNVNGEFEIKYSGVYPVKLDVSFIGYTNKSIEVAAQSDNISISLSVDEELLDEIDVIEQRLSKKQQESALTVEAMDALAIKETPAVSFYDGLGNLKGVDLTSASIGFKIINTRGFNSTSPVRSLQVIDGVDNQAPGLNFSLGNFLGASELDVLNVDIIAGASSAFYGPNAFNGVISMTTKDPYMFKGISASVKVGERQLTEVAVRWADAIKNKDGIEKFAYKLNLYYLTAKDWEADNYDPITDSDYPISNPGRYNAVNTYGDEGFLSGNSDYDDAISANTDQYVGLGKFYRSGYNEIDLVDYNTKNLKLGTSLHYRFKPTLELNYSFNYGTGTTVYQGDNRFSIKGIQFFQNKLELKNKDKWFIRAYATNENAGKSYDAFFTGLRMLERQQTEQNWNTSYANNWGAFYSQQVRNLPGYEPSSNYPNLSTQEWFETIYSPFIDANLEAIQELHRENLAFTDASKLQPGSEEYNKLFNEITSTELINGGTKLYDKSALYHIQGAYNWDIENGKITAGANYRLYAPNSKGNIFNEVQFEFDTIIGGIALYDTVYTVIRNSEVGAYGGVERHFLNEKLKGQITLRVDKNENFDVLFSPAVSMIFNADSKNTFRFSFSSAIRNPTLQDQYLNYNVGIATLKGNLDGYTGLITPASMDTFINMRFPSQSVLEYMDVPGIEPEKVKTFEVGYRATVLKRLYIDASYYYSLYDDFIGYVVGIDAVFDPAVPAIPQSLSVYRISANATSRVTTQGFSVGVNYYLSDIWSINGNYTWNQLNKTGADDPIIPAYNTPENKFNIGFSGRKFKIPFIPKNKWGLNVNYKWVQGFRFEGSPQFTGDIESYGLLDGQISYDANPVTIKLGASNMLNNKVFQVYGGPRVGRMIYLSLLFAPRIKSNI